MDQLSITRAELSAEEIGFLAQLAGNPQNQRKIAALVERIQDYQALTSERKDLGTELFPPIKDRDDLDRFVKLHWALSLATRYEDHFTSFEEFLRTDTNYLGLTLSDICDKAVNEEKRCRHCAAGESKGLMIDFDKLAAVDERFFRLFRHAAFGRKGEPFLYRQKGHDLADMVDLVARKEIPEISFYFGVFDDENPRYEDGTRRLVKTRRKHPGVRLMSGLTYHLFSPDQDRFNHAFAYAFDSCFEFSDEISIELLASEVSEGTAMEKTNQSFEELKPELFRGYRTSDDNVLERGKRKVQLTYKQPNTNVYDIGHFKQYLQKEGLAEKYVEVMGHKTYPPICVSTLNHNFIVLEPDGGVKTCVSFDGMHTPAGINLFEAGYEGMLGWLEKRFHAQRKEVIDKLPELITEKHSMCDCR